MTARVGGRPDRRGGRSRGVAAGGVGLAVAIALPIAVHPFGLGPVLLPMHLPVLVVGGFAGPAVGGLVGALAPLLSHLLTGMPPMVPPVAPLMTAELATYGAVAGLSMRAARLRHGESGRRSPLLVLTAGVLVAMVAGRIVLALAAAALGPLLGLRVPALVYLKAAVASGIPGMLVQVVAVPLILSRLLRDVR